jgi:hypothetical protein
LIFDKNEKSRFGAVKSPILCVYVYIERALETGKSSFQGSLYLSRESLGNHFFEEFQKSRGVDVEVYRKPCLPFTSKC